MAGWPIEVVALRPVSCGSVLWSRRDALHLTIVAKATFGMVNGGKARLIAPAPLVAKDAHHDRSPLRSLERASDLAPYLGKADLLVAGHACAPGGRPVPAMSVRFSVARGEILVDKTLNVFGDRTVASPGTPAPFQRMPLVYERAYGGAGFSANPTGVGASLDPKARLPNLVDPRDPRVPASLGPIARLWSVRQSLADPARRRLLEQPVPAVGDDFPWAYFQAAPVDQQCDFLHGDERILLDGFHPSLSRLTTQLPEVRCAAHIHVVGPGGAGPPTAVGMNADMLVVNADQQSCSVTWRCVVPVKDRAALGALRVFVSIEMPAIPAPWPSPEQIPAAAVSAPERVEIVEIVAEKRFDGQATMGPDLRAAAMPATPFAQAAPPPPAAAPSPGSALPFTPGDPSSSPLSRPSGGRRRPASDDEGSTRLTSLEELEAERMRGAELPFGSPPPSASPPAPQSQATPSARLESPWATGVPPQPAPEPIFSSVPAPPPAPRADLAEPPPAALAGRDEASAARPPPPGEPPTRGDKEAIPIVNPTKLRVGILAWQVRPPKDSLTVVVKGTCDLVADGPAVLRDDGDFPTGDLYVDDEPTKPLLYASDLPAFKPRADVTLTGTAYPPKSAGRTTPASQVTFQFGSGSRGFTRRIAVLGARRWQTALFAVAPTDPAPFESMPLRWDRAFGGASFGANPVGVGHKGQPGADGVPRLPNLEDPAHLVTSPGDAPAPACFGPIPPQWAERWSKIGTYDRRWLKLRWPYFPEDFDWTFSQAAPRAQQLPYLTGDETFMIAGTRPDAPRIDGRLPGVRARCFLQMTKEAGGELRELVLALDTAAFDSDEMKLSLVWRGFLEVTDEEAPEIDAIFIACEELAATPMSLADARAAYARAAVPPPPEKAEPETLPPPPGPRTKEGREEEDAGAGRERMRKELAEAGVPSAPDEPPEAPPPAPDPVSIAASLRAAGASVEEVAEVLAAITPPLPDEDEPPRVEIRARVVEMLAAGEPFDALDLAGANLEDLDFSGRSLVGTILTKARLARSSFAAAKLTFAILVGADLTDAVLEGADLESAMLAGVEAPRADLRKAKLTGADFTGAHLDHGRFDESHGAGVQLVQARLLGASFRGASLVSADFTQATLDGAVFDQASLPEARLYDATVNGASFRGAAMKGARAEGLKGAKAIFANVVAPSSVWERAMLSEATFHGAELQGASFVRATCLGTVFSTADLREARFRKAKLMGAAFLRANLMSANFEAADLRRADLRGANLHAAETWKAKLDDAKLDLAIVTASKLAEG